jgi:hypothetical protein
MIALLLAATLAHFPSHVQPHVREPISVVAGCDDFRQPYVVITNVWHEPLLVEWLSVTEAPPWPIDISTGADVLAPGQFEGWLTSGSHLSLVIQFGGRVRTIEASCPAIR